MQEWKKWIAYIWIIAILGRIFLPFFQYGVKINDPEFDAALQWAKTSGIQDIDEIRKYPFSTITRAEAAQRYVALAHSLEILPETNDTCTFKDIHHLSTKQKSSIQLACAYNFFKWTDNLFWGDNYVTKANSLVALMRGLYPWKNFEEQNPYRTPYVNLAYQQWITKRPSWPYLSYLISKYEMILQLRRVVKLKHTRK